MIHCSCNIHMTLMRTRDSTSCRLGWSVGPSVTFLDCEWSSYYCSCPTVRDWNAVNPCFLDLLFVVLQSYGRIYDYPSRELVAYVFFLKTTDNQDTIFGLFALMVNMIPQAKGRYGHIIDFSSPMMNIDETSFPMITAESADMASQVCQRQRILQHGSIDGGLIMIQNQTLPYF